MDDAPRVHLVVLRGGRTGADDGAAAVRALSREDLRVIPGGPAGELHAAIEETVLAARKMRREIEERIARDLDERF
jgi:hypothetical protein